MPVAPTRSPLPGSRRLASLATGCALLAAALTGATVPAGAATAARTTIAAAAPQSDPVTAAQALAAPGVPGANNWSCKPSPAHPRPMVLVHGTFANGSVNWDTVAPALAADGTCVFVLTYGAVPNVPLLRAIAPVADSAQQLSVFVDGVLAATGAGQVDIVGHSQGGMMPRYYLKFDGGAAKVHTLVGLAPSNHGTTLDGLATLAKSFPGALDLVGSVCPACTDQVTGSDLLNRLNAGGDTVPGVTYWVIATGYDEVVTPYLSQFLSGPDVHNVLVQDLCPTNIPDHVLMAVDLVVLHEVRHALDPAQVATANCWANLTG
ncbi:alpha/beta fold hydrolase [Kitasatospora sp. GP82]|uniref:esterase/lipase family protein n=1 Tax=Kitasatospora sp. GP82 TaxID=3035089 RepID=UPI0024739506|nr:alpha/beta fold hydrolase [Kitasatospora sp. GP82]MDH6127572.1 triacylglycerol esterase/lipase EstA (alpha/beta hydrolase family) [Kitasatospora sp. GP82]